MSRKRINKIKMQKTGYHADVQDTKLGDIINAVHKMGDIVDLSSQEKNPTTRLGTNADIIIFCAREDIDKAHNHSKGIFSCINFKPNDENSSRIASKKLFADFVLSIRYKITGDNE